MGINFAYVSYVNEGDERPERGLTIWTETPPQEFMSLTLEFPKERRNYGFLESELKRYR